MRTGSPIVFGLSIVALLAGCLGGGDSDSDGGNGDGDSVAPTAGGYRLDCSISNWAEPCLAWASPNDSPSKTEVDIVVNPTDPLNVVVASKDLDPLASPCVWAVAQVTKDGGHTWNTTYVGGTLAERQPGDMLYGWDCITDPILAFNPDGLLGYALQVSTLNPNGVVPRVPVPVLGNPIMLPPRMGIQVLALSSDGGESFGDMKLMHAGDNVAVFHDFLRMGSNPTTGTLFSAWQQVSLVTAQPVVTAYQPGSPVARPPVYFPRTEAILGMSPSGIVADSAGTVYAWFGGLNNGGVAYVASSADDGLTFTMPTQAFSFSPLSPAQPFENATYRAATIVEIAVDTSGGERDGCLYAAWADAGADSEGIADIFLRSSCDGAATWSEPVLVNTMRREDVQWMPRITVDGHGNLHIVYFTRAYDPAHRLLDAEWAVSTDGGATWDSARITTVSFDGDLGLHQDGDAFIGDYIGISSVGGDVWMGFPTTMTGRAEIAVAHAVHEE
ncbi:MAG TPA: sialidase family protein [Candidatus Thermoplasmatota archaeon]|nr:sialidase family protein [Candidatus Thermoplasmatota archaeon]